MVVSNMTYSVKLGACDKRTKQIENFEFKRINISYLKNNKDCYRDACNTIAALRETMDCYKWFWNMEFLLYEYIQNHDRCRASYSMNDETENYRYYLEISCIL